MQSVHPHAKLKLKLKKAARHRRAEQILAAGELEVPRPAPETMLMAIPNKEGLGDAGHRG